MCVVLGLGRVGESSVVAARRTRTAGKVCPVGGRSGGATLVQGA